MKREGLEIDNMFYAVIDTNVLVSALLSKRDDSATVQVLKSIFSSVIVPLYTYEILAEYDEVLHRTKFPFREADIQKTIEIIQEYGVYVANPTPTGEVLLDSDDLIFYEVVMEKRADDSYLITGNLRHFPRKTFIVTPAEMMAIIADK